MKRLVIFISFLFVLVAPAEQVASLKLDDETRIEKYSQGKITIAGELIRTDILIMPDGSVVHPWSTKKRHDLTSKDIPELIQKEMDVLIIGTGIHGQMKVASGFKKELKKMKYKVLYLKTRSAIKKLEDYRKEGTQVGACFHIGC